jgi:anti-anti-sigma regulatory factor
LVVPTNHGVDARRKFLGTASDAIDRADDMIEIDCSGVDERGPSLVGMLVTIARNAHRRRVRVALINTSPQLRRQLGVAEVADPFVISQ